jgi:DNA-binding NtrC family response regulator
MPTKSPAFRDLLARLKRIADNNLAILFLAETGTGKTVLAQAVHNASSRSAAPFISFNASGLTDQLAGTELFGHEKGAFTGAVQRHVGRFERASGGTLFFDEIGDLPLGVQAQILHALEYKQFERVGGTETLSADVRIIAATNHDLGKMVAEGRFRQDLLYRLKQACFRIPPLRERKEDLGDLIARFVKEASIKYRRNIKSIAPDAERALLQHSWPGNVRELRAAIYVAVAMSMTHELTLADLPEDVRPKANSVRTDLVTLEESERRYIGEVLGATAGNKSETSRILGITRKTLYEKMRRYGFAAPGEEE